MCIRDSVYTLLEEDKVTKPVAEALYMGIIHDTGVFQYSCTTPETMAIGAKLMEMGIDFSKIVDKTFYEKSYVQNQILGRCLMESIMVLDGKCIVAVSYTHLELVKRLFEAEVTEVKDGTVEIKSIAREAGSRTKIAVWSNDSDVDPVGACVVMNGASVNSIVEELRGEKIDIINWSENPAILIENALSPAKVISVMADPEEKNAMVIVPDFQSE